MSITSFDSPLPFASSLPSSIRSSTLKDGTFSREEFPESGYKLPLFQGDEWVDYHFLALSAYSTEHLPSQQVPTSESYPWQCRSHHCVTALLLRRSHTQLDCPRDNRCHSFLRLSRSGKKRGTIGVCLTSLLPLSLLSDESKLRNGPSFIYWLLPKHFPPLCPTQISVFARHVMVLK